MHLPRLTRNGHFWLSSAAYVIASSVIFFFGVTAAGRHASLELTPASFPVCQGPNVRVHVRWNAASSTHKSIKIFVHGAGNAPKLWFSGAPLGETVTGKWMADGSTLDLTDHNGKLLARRTMVTTLCAQR